ncbi:hypothetical protein D3C86_1788720 [compost metagenome]
MPIMNSGIRPQAVAMRSGMKNRQMTSAAFGSHVCCGEKIAFHGMRFCAVIAPITSAE